MEAISIKNFKFGMDTRRERMSCLSGVLESLIDGHIDQGGQCEQRKSFVLQVGTLAFGLESLGSTLVTFGSIASPGSFPANVIYQRLQHPDGATAMTKIVYSASYSGKAAAIALFADGAAFAYYDGTLISDNIAGLILPYMATATFGSNNAIALFLSNLVNATDYPSSSSLLAVVTISSPLGITLNVDTAVVSAAGTLATTLFTTAVPPVVGAQAIGRFRVVAGTQAAANKVTSVKVGTQECLTGAPTAVPWTTSNEVTVGLLVTAINAFTGTSGYQAVQSGSTVLIYSSAFSTSANNKDVVVKSAGTVCIGLSSFGLVNSPTASSGPITAVTSVKVTSTELLTTTPINKLSTIEQLCIDVATDINAGTSAGITHGYVACPVGDVIFLSRATTSSADADLSVLILVTGGGVTGGNNTDTGLDPVVTPIVFGTASQSGTNNGTLVSLPASVVLTGGISPFTYLWERLSISNPRILNQFNPVAGSPTSYTTVFNCLYYKGYVTGGLFTGSPFEKLGIQKGDIIASTWRCKVTDSQGTVVNSNTITVNHFRLK